MQSKSNVLLTELIIVVLFFSLIAVTVVQMFVAAYRQSTQAARVQRALIVAQDCAEQISGQSEPADALLEAGFTMEAAGTYDKEEDGFLLKAKLQPTQVSSAGLLVGGEVRVFASGAADADALVTLPAFSYIPQKEATRH
jgi:Tfp pilus assembly protein PilV